MSILKVQLCLYSVLESSFYRADSSFYRAESNFSHAESSFNQTEQNPVFIWSGQCLTCTFRACCCSTRLSWAHVPAFVSSSVWDKDIFYLAEFSFYHAESIFYRVESSFYRAESSFYHAEFSFYETESSFYVAEFSFYQAKSCFFYRAESKVSNCN